MEKEFEDYWLKHQKRLILKSPKNLREEYLESTRLDTPMDWVCFVLPIAVGIILQPRLNFESEILSWGVVLLVVVVPFCATSDGQALSAKEKDYDSGIGCY